MEKIAAWIGFRRPPEQELAAKIAGIKSRLRPEPFDWYPYDTLTNLQHLQQLVSPLPEGLRQLAGEAPVGDFGAGDGDLAFWLESLGLQVIAADFPVRTPTRCAASSF